MDVLLKKGVFNMLCIAGVILPIMLGGIACQPDDAILTGPSDDDGAQFSASDFGKGHGMGNRYSETYIDRTSGGTLSFNNGELTIPPDSIDASKLIWAETYNLQRGDFLKRIFIFGPSGTVFSPAATLTLSYCDMGDMLPDTIKLMLYNNQTGEWEIASHMVNNPENQTFSGPIQHFSRYSLSGNGQILQPKLESN